MALSINLHPKFNAWKPRTIERNRKWALEYFIKHGKSTHSGMALTLPFIMQYCEEHGIAYILKAAPGKGYYIEKWPEGK